MFLQLLALVIFVIIAETCYYNEKFFGIFISLVIYGATLYWILDTNFILIMYNNMHTVLLCFAFYIVIGIIYSLIKWKLHIRDVVNSYTLKDLKEIKDNASYAVSRDYRRQKTILNYLTWWPICLLGDILTDPFKAIYNYLSDIYSKIEKSEINRAIKKLEKK